MSITPIPVDMKMAVLERYGWNCLCCGRPMHRYPDSRVRPDTLSFDHVLAEKNGGLTVVENLQPLCMACNLHKGVDTIDLRGEAELWRYRLDKYGNDYLRSSPSGLMNFWRAKPVWSMSRFRIIDPVKDKEKRSFVQKVTDDLRSRRGAPLVSITDEEWKKMSEKNDVVKLNWYAFRTDYRIVNKAVPPCPVRDRMRIAA